MNIFSEIYGTYFHIAEKLLSKPAVSEDDIRREVARSGFRDSVLFLPQKLIPCGEDWGLFTRQADGSICRITKNAPVKVLTNMQKMWLKAKLSDARIRLFMDKRTIAQLESRLSDTPALYQSEHIRVTDRFSDSDSFADPQYIRHLRTVLGAVKRSTLLYIEYTCANGRKLSGRFAPLKIEYSPKNDKFRLCCRRFKSGKAGKCTVINIGRITFVKDTKKRFSSKLSAEDLLARTKCTEPAVIRVTDERRGFERFMNEFASLEKHTETNTETGEHIVKLWYDKNDETELLIQLLSFGPVIEILSPPPLREKARERISRQFALLAQ